jgi:hypothetical protein
MLNVVAPLFYAVCVDQTFFCQMFFDQKLSDEIFTGQQNKSKYNDLLKKLGQTL